MKLEDIHSVDAKSLKKRDDFNKSSPAEKEQTLEREMERANLEKQKNFKELAEEETDENKKKLYKKTFEISNKISERGGIALVIGGFARDSVMKSIGYNLEPKDIDIEVYGLEISELKEILTEFGEVNTVGQSFGILKIGDLDISIPRLDSKTGKGHKGFETTSDPKMSIKEAARRRDLTINTLALNPATGEVIDVFGGIDDILDKKLKATDPEFFKDDPLRVLRIMQFAGRFGFDVEERTREICIELVRNGALDELPIERFGEEWKKLLLKSEKPSKGLEVAKDLEIISHYPELESIIGCKQENDWHPEGDVWTHTLMVVDEAKKIAVRENLDNKQSLVLLLSSLCHDLGKPLTTKIQKVKDVDRITSYGHEAAGIEPARNFLRSINIPNDIIKEILPLISCHLFPTTYNEKITDVAIRRLAKKISPATIQELVMLGEADLHGRAYWTDQPNAVTWAREWKGYESGKKLLSDAEKLSDISTTNSKAIKYITGKTLIDLGLKTKSGKDFGLILKELEKAQEEGKITGPDDLRLAKLLVFLNKIEERNGNEEKLLTGEILSTNEMIEEIKDRFFEVGTHDMGTLVMTLLLKGEKLPPILERNKTAILTAHKHGPIWFKHFEKEFYETSWKSFYGQFEVNLQKQKELSLLDFEEQLQIGLSLITKPDENSIREYKESFDVKPVKQSGKMAYYVTDLYPFETGMIDGYEIMVQYSPDNKRLCISVMDENPEKVIEIDRKIRQDISLFKNAKKIGYLFASNEHGEDGVFSEEDGENVFDYLQKNLEDKK